MADLEEFRSEEATLDLEVLECFSIFDLREISKRLDAFKSKVSKRKVDFEELIQYEVSLLRSLQRRVPKEHPKKKEGEAVVAQHINKLFSQGTAQFSDDLCFWLSYFKFLDRVKLVKCPPSKKVWEMLRSNSHKPSVWKLAADWEYKHKKNIKSARQYLLRGLRFHPESRLLYTEAFRMELIYADRIHQQIAKKEAILSEQKTEEVPKTAAAPPAAAPPASSPAAAPATTTSSALTTVSAATSITTSASVAAVAPSIESVAQVTPAPGTSSQVQEAATPNPPAAGSSASRTGDNLMYQVLEGRLAERMFELASKKIDDVTFHISLLNIAKKFNFTDKLQGKIINDMLSRYADHELTWDTMARRELEGLCYSPEVNDVPVESAETSDETASCSSKNKNDLRERIRRCCCAYQFGCGRVNTVRMWSLYLDALIEINQDPKANLPNHKRNLLGEALEKCHNALRMEEKYYHYWINFCSNKKTQQGKVLEEATKRFPLSEQLWDMRLCFNLQEGNEEECERVFKEAIDLLGADNKATLPLREMMILYWQIKSTLRVEELFKEGVVLGPDVSNELKPKYLDWLVLSKDMRAARETYQKLCALPPFCLKFHQKMISLELNMPDVDIERIRKCYKMACHQFGKKNPDVWMEYIKFELKRGDKKKVQEIRDEALETLDPFLAENWQQELCLVTNCMLPFGGGVPKEYLTKESDENMEVDS